MTKLEKLARSYEIENTCSNCETCPPCGQSPRDAYIEGFEYAKEEATNLLIGILTKGSTSNSIYDMMNIGNEDEQSTEESV